MTIPSSSGIDRENFIIDAVRNNQHDPIEWHAVQLAGRGNRGEVFVMGDALKIGGVRYGCSARTQQTIADILGASLCTDKIADETWNQATLHIPPVLMPGDARMSDTDVMVAASKQIDALITGKPNIVRNVGKYWLIHRRLLERIGVAINYGFYDVKAPNQSHSLYQMWQTAGSRHDENHSDYSQLCQLVLEDMLVNGELMKIQDVMRHAEYSWLLSYDGVMPVTRMPDPKPKSVSASAPTPKPPAPTPTVSDYRFIQAKNYRKGRIEKIRWIVLHSTESGSGPGSAAAVANWFAGSSAPQASSHFVVDSSEVIRCVADEDTAWAAPGANAGGIQIEMCGRAKYTEAEWPAETVSKVTELVAALTKKHSLPLEFVDAAGLLAGKPGVTTHLEVSRAFKKSTHTDPGAGFRIDKMLAMARTL